MPTSFYGKKLPCGVNKNLLSKMKNLYLAAMFAFAVGTITGNAQEKVQDSKVGQSTTTTMTDVRGQMNLSPEQKARFDEIVRKHNIATRDIQKRRYSRENKDAKLEQLNQQTEAEMKTFLKPEQYQTYLKLNARHKSEKVDMRKKPVLGSVNAK